MGYYYLILLTETHNIYTLRRVRGIFAQYINILYREKQQLNQY